MVVPGRSRKRNDVPTGKTTKIPTIVMINDRKGFVMDAIPIIVMLFGFAIVSVVAMKFFAGVDAGLNLSTDPNAARGVAIAAQVNDDIDWVMDFILVMAMVSLPIGSMILAFFNNIPPFFYFASLGVVLLVVVFGAALAEGWTNSNDTAEFSSGSSRLPMTNFIMENFGKYALFCIMIIMAGTYVKIQNSQGF